MNILGLNLEAWLVIALIAAGLALVVLLFLLAIGILYRIKCFLFGDGMYYPFIDIDRR